MDRRTFKFTVNTLLFTLLLAILVFPATTLSWISLQEKDAETSEVLPSSTSTEQLDEFFIEEPYYPEEDFEPEILELDETFESTPETVLDTRLEE